MTNEIILIAELVLVYAAVPLIYRFAGKTGLYMWSAIATILANIEVLILVRAFGMEQTLGNILFASTFLVTDILSEKYGKREAKIAVNIGILASFSFLVISQLWLLYTPCESDWAFESFKTLFTQTPRIMLVSLLVYALVQKFDVWAYHKWWELTEKISGNRKSLLWIRNNGSTLISQLLNTILYTFGAFGSLYDTKTLINICISTYVIYICTSIADTPAIYIARRMRSRRDSDSEGDENKIG
ncbi:MAG: queuosine precursor transporter [Clostridia bacterium]|nr:queuosine precursor transporter [Clostridia bacterium]